MVLRVKLAVALTAYIALGFISAGGVAAAVSTSISALGANTVFPAVVFLCCSYSLAAAPFFLMRGGCLNPL